MRRIAFWFFASAAIYVVVGMVFGIWMSASQDHSLAPVHGHLNLIGWVSMAIFGVFYHLVPSAAASRLATIHFWLMTAAIWIMVPGIAMAIQGTGETLAKVGSLLALLGMLTFVAVLFRSGRRLA
jgi:cbb3-type cytochrome oxidase subunit 1